MLKVMQTIGISWSHIERKTPLGPEKSGHYHRNRCGGCKRLSWEIFNVYFAEEINAQDSNFIVIYRQEPNLFYSNELQVIDKTPGIAGFPHKTATGVGTSFSQKKNIDIVGVTEDYKDTSNIIMENGSFIRDQDFFLQL